LRRVLIIDDEDADRHVILRILEAQGHSVEAVKNGLQGLQMVAEFRPDVILLDLNMPGFDGYDVCRHIRRTKWGKKASIYAITGLRRPGDLMLAQRAGFNGMLSKPLDAEALAQLFG
jgi:CheY-like chemotaxis protein